MKYGKMVDLGYNPMRNEFKTILTNYFNNPLMTKVDDYNGRSIYMVEIKTMLVKDRRYLILNVDKNGDEIGSTKKMMELQFKIAQMKEMDGIVETPVKQCLYSVRENNADEAYRVPIELIKRTKEITDYDVPDYGIKLSMIHKDNFLHEYPDRANLLSAIEKYSTLIFIE